MDPYVVSGHLQGETQRRMSNIVNSNNGHLLSNVEHDLFRGNFFLQFLFDILNYHFETLLPLEIFIKTPYMFFWLALLVIDSLSF